MAASWSGLAVQKHASDRSGSRRMRRNPSAMEHGNRPTDVHMAAFTSSPPRKNSSTTSSGR